MSNIQKLEAKKDFATGCKRYQNGVEVKNDQRWPAVQENVSFEDTLRQTRVVSPIQKGNER